MWGTEPVKRKEPKPSTVLQMTYRLSKNKGWDERIEAMIMTATRWPLLLARAIEHMDAKQRTASKKTRVKKQGQLQKKARALETPLVRERRRQVRRDADLRRRAARHMAEIEAADGSDDDETDSDSDE